MEIVTRDLNHYSLIPLHTTSTITRSSTLPQLSLTTLKLLLEWAPHYLNHHSQQTLHITSTITHNTHSTVPQPSHSSDSPHYLNHHSPPQYLDHHAQPQYLDHHSPPHYLNHHSQYLNHHSPNYLNDRPLHTTSTITHR